MGLCRCFCSAYKIRFTWHRGPSGKPNCNLWSLCWINRNVSQSKNGYLTSLLMTCPSTYRILATSFFNPSSRVPFSGIILVDPPLWSRAKANQYTELYKLIEATTPIRKDIWKDFETASQWLRDRLSWDKRVLDIYIVRLAYIHLEKEPEVYFYF